MEQINSWLEPIKAQIPPDLDVGEAARLQEAITIEAMARFGAFVAGIKSYQSSPAQRHQAGHDCPVLWQRGSTRLLDYAPESDGPCVLVVPSLVNRFDILDIDADFSFLRYLAGAGLRPVVVDWGLPAQEERGFDLSGYMQHRLLPVLNFVCGLQGGAACSVLGYCMGGMMALAMAALRPQQVKALGLLATPWDFSVGVGGVPSAETTLGALFMQQAMSAEAYLEKVGIMPPALLQTVFTSFQPLQILQKFSRFAEGDTAEGPARRFVLTEDWLNDGVPLALPVAHETLRDWYAANLPMKNEWRMDGVLIDPAALSQPCYVVVAERDRIVPPESTFALAKRLSRAILHQVPLGHIGLMSSDGAPDRVWKPLAAWLGDR